ncbi:MAG: polyphenol oxidase family protein [Actinobacteria bacterium]|nr:polyphenol oxidase family protein [Actinomycetota bacterium]
MHGSDVLVVGSPGEHVGEEADALVTTNPEVALMVRTADCAPMALAAAEGVIGVTHGGWRGLLGGVVESTCTAMRRLGASRIELALGPSIRPCCYCFSSDDLDSVAEVLGESVRSHDRHGRPALDLPAAVAAAVARAGAELTFADPRCTGCAEVDGTPSFWSHRVRQDAERQAVVAWLN